MYFGTIDFAILLLYCLIVLGAGLWVANKKDITNTQGYFLANKSLPWWAVGTSIIAANISAEQIIGMSGSGYAVGLAIATYEWLAALTLIIVAKFILPIFLEKNISTMPQFLEYRFDERVRVSMAIFWILLYIFVNLTSVLYLGALTLETVLGIKLIYGIVGLAAFSALYAIYGGLSSVAWTDVIQVVFLMGGGLLTTYLALDAFSNGNGAFIGLVDLVKQVPDRFHMILDQDNPYYYELPGIRVIFGGLWVTSISYWGFNQYIIQKALAAKSMKEAQWGLMFAGYQKFIIPLIVVIPGIAAFGLGAEISRSDAAFPWLLSNIVTPGFRGLIFAALIAAIASSLASMINSTSTIFTLDIYKIHIDSDVSEKKLLFIGRIASFIAICLAVSVAPFLSTLDQAFQFIQEFTGFISPAVAAIFLFGFFWKKTTANGALWAAILSIPLSFGFKWLTPELPFIDRIGIVFLILCTVIIAISLIEGNQSDQKAIHFEKELFYTDTVFNIGSIGISIILAILYILFY